MNHDLRGIGLVTSKLDGHRSASRQRHRGTGGLLGHISCIRISYGFVTRTKHAESIIPWNHHWLNGSELMGTTRV